MLHYSKISLLITLCIFFVLCMSGCSSSSSSSSSGSGSNTDVVSVDEVKITGHENVTVNGKTTLRFYDILQLQAVVSPADTSCENILWSSSDENVSPGDANGRVEINNWAGSVTITATAVDKLNQPCGDNASASIDVEFI